MAGVTNATLTVATAVGHHMQGEDPELVLSAIQRVVTAASRNGPR
jgi:hypothetical protein